MRRRESPASQARTLLSKLVLVDDRLPEDGNAVRPGGVAKPLRRLLPDLGHLLAEAQLEDVDVGHDHAVLRLVLACLNVL